MGHIAYQPPFSPIRFSIDTDGKIKVTVEAMIVSPLGTIAAGGGIYKDMAGRPLPPEPADVSQLIICQAGSAQQRCEGYQIGTGRKLRIDMVGSSTVYTERNRTTIEPALGSVVTVTDNGPPTKLEAYPPARVDMEELYFHETSPETEVDLERSRSGTSTGLSYDHITAELKPINGAKVSTYDTYRWGEPEDVEDYPSELECMQTPIKNWKTTFSKDALDSKKYIISCIKTAEGDLGYLLIDPDTGKKPVAYYVLSYIWVR